MEEGKLDVHVIRNRNGKVLFGRGPGPDDLDDVLTFMRLLWAVDHGMRTVSKQMKAHVGVTGPERLILRMLGHFPSVSPGELALLLHVHPSTLTGVLKRLVGRKLIDRRADSRDGRQALLALTGAGSRLDRLRAGTVEAHVRQALRGMPKSKVSAAREILGALARALGSVEVV